MNNYRTKCVCVCIIFWLSFRSRLLFVSKTVSASELYVIEVTARKYSRSSNCSQGLLDFVKGKTLEAGNENFFEVWSELIFHEEAKAMTLSRIPRLGLSRSHFTLCIKMNFLVT